MELIYKGNTTIILVEYLRKRVSFMGSYLVDQIEMLLLKVV